MNMRMSRYALTLAFALLQIPQMAGAQGEGIKVHGRWTIDVREPGGALVTHREFENELTPAGATSLATFLSRGAVPGLWKISLLSILRPPCGAAIAQHCFMVELNDPVATVARASYYFPNLAVARDGSTLVLNGTATSGYIGEIDFVTTVVGLCAPGLAPQSCDELMTFTTTRIRDPLTTQFAPIPVTAVGQIIQVKVVISFQ